MQLLVFAQLMEILPGGAGDVDGNFLRGLG